ncbi:MAG: PorT family protein, partial [Candidatus Aminicenantes bacterium]|nr:PorT family protein [Candidatus Aminicenantes bacterium]
MKKLVKGLTVISALVLLLIVTTTPSRAGVKFGVKGGITLANIKAVPDTFEGYKWENKMGLVGGVFAEVGLAKGFSLQPEVLYIQKGAKISVSEGEITGTVKFNVDYIEIPVLLKYNLISSGL